MSKTIGERHASACRYKAMYRRAHAAPLAGLISDQAEYENRVVIQAGTLLQKNWWQKNESQKDLESWSVFFCRPFFCWS